jgi:hypothetical protein
MEPEQIGRHKGALEALLGERIELIRLLQIVELLISRHAKALQDAGVDVKAFLKELQAEQKAKLERAQREAQQRAKEEKKYDLTKMELEREDVEF